MSSCVKCFGLYFKFTAGGETSIKAITTVSAGGAKADEQGNMERRVARNSWRENVLGEPGLRRDPKICAKPLRFDIVLPGLEDIPDYRDVYGCPYLTWVADSSYFTNITWFSNLKYVTLNENKLTGESISCLSKLTGLECLNLSRNEIDYVSLEPIPSLKRLDLSHNKLRCFHDLKQPALETLILSHNKIEEALLVSKDLPSLEELDLSDNYLTEMDGIFVAQLKSLYLAHNVIKSVDPLCVMYLRKLERISLRNNYIDDLIAFVGGQCKNLNYLNVRDNNISYVTLFAIFAKHEDLKTIILTGNPVMTNRSVYEENDLEAADLDEENVKEIDENFRLRASMLVCVPSLQRINKHTITQEEKGAALTSQMSSFISFVMNVTELRYLHLVLEPRFRELSIMMGEDSDSDDDTLSVEELSDEEECTCTEGDSTEGDSTEGEPDVVGLEHAGEMVHRQANTGRNPFPVFAWQEVHPSDQEEPQENSANISNEGGSPKEGKLHHIE